MAPNKSRIAGRKSLNGLDLYALLDDLRESVEGRWIQKIYGKEDRWEIALQGGSLCLNLGGWVNFGKCPFSRPDKPGSFCGLLRKHLVGKVESLEQRDHDRVIRLSVRDKKLIVELFRKGNIILTDAEGNIIASLRKIEEGVYPWDYKVADISEIDAIMDGKKRNLVKTLAVDYGLGGLYAEELCLRSNIGKNQTTLAGEEKEYLRAQLRGLLGELETAENRKPMILFDGEEVIDVVPINMEIYGSFIGKSFPSFNDAVAQYLSLVSSVPAPKIRKEDRILAMQKEKLEQLEDEAKKIRALCEWIYSNYQKAQELSEVELDGYRVKLDGTRGLEGNISVLYGKAKSAEEKAERIGVIMKSARKKIERNGARSDLWKPGKRWWFEKFRWALTSEGTLIIGGRDARGNDALVKKHLKDRDIYAHADVQGAPSVVLKDGLEATDQSKRETCHFALIFSKAWKMRRPARTYWVMADQVSKSPPSGEFLARGAFMISGKRNFIDNLDLLADVGWVELEGEKRLVCSPPGVLESYVRIEPADESKRKDLIRELSRRFSVHPDYVDSILPGGGRVVEK